MPWCPQCDQYLAPSAVRTDGSCPACGLAVDPGGLAKQTDTEHGADGAEDEHPPLPWHLKVLSVAVVLYLAFRAWPLVEWVIQQL